MAEDIGRTLYDELAEMGRLDRWPYVADLINNGKWDEAIKYVEDLSHTEKPTIPAALVLIILAIIFLLVVF